jgi:hypothetical protein
MPRGKNNKNATNKKKGKHKKTLTVDGAFTKNIVFKDVLTP